MGGIETISTAEIPMGTEFTTTTPARRKHGGTKDYLVIFRCTTM